MHTLFTNLMFNMFPLKKTINISNYGTLPYITIPYQDLNPDFIKLLESQSLGILEIERFYVNPYSPSIIQTNYPGQDVSKLFFMYTINGTIINWYDINTESNTSLNADGYYQYNPTEVTFEFSTVVKFPTLIQAGLPTNFKNPKERIYCLSVVLSDGERNTISIDTAMSKLSGYIVNPK